MKAFRLAALAVLIALIAASCTPPNMMVRVRNDTPYTLDEVQYHISFYNIPPNSVGTYQDLGVYGLSSSVVVNFHNGATPGSQMISTLPMATSTMFAYYFSLRIYQDPGSSLLKASILPD